jgi:hypothetical protein
MERPRRNLLAVPRTLRCGHGQKPKKFAGDSEGITANSRVRQIKRKYAGKPRRQLFKLVGQKDRVWDGRLFEQKCSRA